MIYKVSYVVVGGKKKYPSGVMNQYERPKVGELVQLGSMKFEIVEVERMTPPNDDFEFLHATVKPIDEADDA
jgi:histidyl-tRNA synthetase